MSDRWPILARNVPNALDELEAVWRTALESGAHVEGDWRELGVCGNSIHRHQHLISHIENGTDEDDINANGRGLMIRQLMIELQSSRVAPK